MMFFEQPKKPKHRQRLITNIRSVVSISPIHIIIELFDNQKTKFITYELCSNLQMQKIVVFLKAQM